MLGNIWVKDGGGLDQDIANIRRFLDVLFGYVALA